MNKPGSTLIRDLMQFARGVLMGGADVVPGVSGGTVALILGIYARLVAALSHFDATLFAHLSARRWGAAVHHLDLRFLLALGAGILSGIVALGGLMNTLLTTSATRGPTLAAFFGMIVASTVLVARWIRPSADRGAAMHLLWAIAGGLLAYEITCLPTMTLEPSLPYLFLCGVIGICAMILPGISGAYLLLVLGVYVYLTDILKSALHGQLSAASVSSAAVFAAGCLVGLLTFSKLLRWLLARYQSVTLAVLCGFMIGALQKIWPFQRDLTPWVDKLKYKQFENVWPQTFDGQFAITVFVGVAAMLIVLGVDRWARNREDEDLQQAAPK